MGALDSVCGDSPYPVAVDALPAEPHVVGRGLPIGDPVGAWARSVARNAAAAAVSEGVGLDQENSLAEVVAPVVEDFLAVVRDDGKANDNTTGFVAGHVTIAASRGATLYQLLCAIGIAQHRIVGRFTSLPFLEHKRRIARAAAHADLFSRSIAKIYVSGEGFEESVRAVERARVIRNMLAGESVDLAEVERVLKVDMSGHHQAVVFRSSSDKLAPDGELARFAEELAQLLGSRSMLLTSTGGRGVCLWLGWRRPPGARPMRARAALVPPPWLQAVFGPITQGVEGFRRTYIGARAASHLPAHPDTWYRDYRDVALQSLVLADPEQAQCLATVILGPLAEPDRGVAELRKTLRTYLAAGRSRLHSASRLHVARNTVAYRVAKAVKLLGRELERDEVDLRIALEIAHLTQDGQRPAQSPQ